MSTSKAQNGTLDARSVAFLVLLREASSEFSYDIDLTTPLARFLVSQLLATTPSLRASNLDEFCIELTRAVSDESIVNRCRATLDSLASFHEFYKYLSTNTKSARQALSRLEQGNVLDLFLRRLFLQLTRLDFAELLRLFGEFAAFREGERKRATGGAAMERTMRQWELLLENYPHELEPSAVERELSELERGATPATANKLIYLRTLNEANAQRAQTAFSNLNRFYDRSIASLFPAAKDGIGSRIAQPSLAAARTNLRLGFVDEAVAAFEESLRLAQNHGDERSINACLLLLGKLASVLGNSREEQQLAEQATMHAMKLNNPLLMLYACLAAGALALHKPQEAERGRTGISWVDGLHYSGKKLLAGAELKDLAIFHNFALPRVLTLLLKGLHLTQAGESLLPDALLNLLRTLYPREVLSAKALELLLEFAFRRHFVDLTATLELYKSIGEAMAGPAGAFSMSVNLLLIQLATNLGEWPTAEFLEAGLVEALACSPLELAVTIKTWALRNSRLVLQGRYNEALDSSARLKDFLMSIGWTKTDLINEDLTATRALLAAGELLPALGRAKVAVGAAKQAGILELELEARLLKLLALVRLNYSLEPFHQLRRVRHWISRAGDVRVQALGHYVAALVQLRFAGTLLGNDGLRAAVESLNSAIAKYITIGNVLDAGNCYYLLARTFDLLGCIPEREASAYFYNVACEFTSASAQNKDLSFYSVVDHRSFAYFEMTLDHLRTLFKLVPAPSAIL